ERRRPRRHGERYDVALLDRQRLQQRELDGRAEERRELLWLALRDCARAQLAPRVEDRDLGLGLAAELVVEERRLLGARLAERDRPSDDVAVLGDGHQPARGADLG